MLPFILGLLEMLTRNVRNDNVRPQWGMTGLAPLSPTNPYIGVVGTMTGASPLTPTTPYTSLQRGWGMTGTSPVTPRDGLAWRSYA
ncbi:MAG: hypothetical protein NVSMB38_35400 [Ktedonobacteraceae bacterium]